MGSPRKTGRTLVKPFENTAKDLITHPVLGACPAVASSLS